MKYLTEKETIAYRKEFWFSSLLASLFITILNGMNNHNIIIGWQSNNFIGFIMIFVIFTLAVIIARMIIQLLIYVVFNKALHPKDEIAELEKKVKKINIRIKNLNGDWSVEDPDDF
jgi:membrane protein insertase Oxa1/YidC/SpoIIIJ